MTEPPATLFESPAPEIAPLADPAVIMESDVAKACAAVESALRACQVNQKELKDYFSSVKTQTEDPQTPFKF